MVVAELRIVPSGTGTSFRDEVETVIGALDKTGIKYEVGPSGTTIESDDLDEILAAVRAAHEAAVKTAPRVFTQLSIDDRQDKKETIESSEDVTVSR